MGTITLENLIATLSELEFIDADQAGQLLQLAVEHTTATDLAAELVRQHRLTPYQAERLLAGQGKDIILGGYRLLEPLGEGGMGQVFKAEQRRLGRTVALKVIHQEYLAHRPEAVRRFQREARAAAQLTHPNAIRIYDADNDGLRHFIVMEYVEGADLARLVESGGPLPVAVACDYIGQTALGLQHAHELGLIHRDVKPSNLLITRSPVSAMRAAASETATGRPSPAVSHEELRQTGVVKIVDMGLARVMQSIEGERSGSLTIEGNVMGTPDYIAPEQARDPHKVDGRADIYSLGCTFYFALTGRPPFPKASALEKLLMQQLDEPIPVEAVQPHVPTSVGAIVRRMMAKDPQARYQSALEVHQALAGVAAEVAQLPCERPRSPEMVPLESTAECVVYPALPSSIIGPELEPPPLASPSPEVSIDWPSLLSELPKDDTRERTPPQTPADHLFNAPQEVQWKSLAELPDIAKDPTKETPPYRTPLEFENKPPSTVDEPIPGPPTQLSFPELPDLPMNTAALIQLDWARRIDDITRAPNAVPLELIKGHRGCVVALAFAHQEDLLASCGIDGTVKLWYLEGAKSKLLAVLQPQGSEVHSIAFAPNDRLAAYGTLDGKLWICTIAAEHSAPYDLMQLDRERISCVRFSHDGRYLGVAAGKNLTIFELTSDKLRRWADLGPHEGPIVAFEFSADGKHVASIAQDGLVRIWNPHRYWNKLVGKTQVPDVNCLAYSPDGKKLALGTSSRTIQAWHMAADPPHRYARIPYSHGCLRLVQYPQTGHGLLTVEDQGMISLRDLLTGSSLQEWSVPFVKAYTFALAPDGHSLATGNTDGTIIVHSL